MSTVRCLTRAKNPNGAIGTRWRPMELEQNMAQRNTMVTEEQDTKEQWKRFSRRRCSSSSPINNLDDGCLMHIFSFLPPIPGITLFLSFPFFSKSLILFALFNNTQIIFFSNFTILMYHFLEL